MIIEQLRFLEGLSYEASHSVGGLLLHLPSDVGVGVQREARDVAPRNAGHCLDVHALLDRQRSEGMAESGIDPEVSEIKRLMNCEGFTWVLGRKYVKNYEVAATRAVISAYRLCGTCDGFGKSVQPRRGGDVHLRPL